MSISSCVSVSVVRLAGGGFVTDGFMPSSLYCGDIYLSSLKLGGVAPLVADLRRLREVILQKKLLAFGHCPKGGRDQPEFKTFDGVFGLEFVSKKGFNWLKLIPNLRKYCFSPSYTKGTSLVSKPGTEGGGGALGEITP